MENYGDLQCDTHIQMYQKEEKKLCHREVYYFSFKSHILWHIHISEPFEYEPHHTAWYSSILIIDNFDHMFYLFTYRDPHKSF